MRTHDQIFHKVPVAEVLAPVALGTVVWHLHAELQVPGRDPVHLRRDIEIRFVIIKLFDKLLPGIQSCKFGRRKDTFGGHKHS